MQTKKRARVGVFDSGIGGLTVLRACVERFPSAEYFYLGDNFRAPYGNRSREEIEGFVTEALDTFDKIGVDAVVLACNTATAVCIDKMRRRYTFPIVGTEPAVAPACRRCKKILVLCTRQTAESERLKTLRARFPAVDITVHPCKNLARLIERRMIYGEPFELEKELPKGEYDGIVLGCTHYVFIKDEIGTAFPRTLLFDGNEGVANRLAELFENMIGTNFHEYPQPKKTIYMSNNVIYFLGKAKSLNKKVFFKAFF